MPVHNVIDIAVVGGGASGLMAAIAAKTEGLTQNAADIDVVILEQGERVGRKLLATGNGRCNLSNINAGERDYNPAGETFVKAALGALPPVKTIELFKRMGLLCRVEEGGLVYPHSNQASSVLDILRMECSRLGVTVQIGFQLTCIKKSNGLFSLESAANETLPAKTVLFAAGGMAAPVYGSNGEAARLLETMGHVVVPMTPALVQLTTRAELVRPLKGQRAKGVAVLFENGQKKAVQAGEIQFTEYGLSGIAVMQLSRYVDVKRKGTYTIEIDLLPDLGEQGVVGLCRQRAENYPHMPGGEIFTGMINKRVGQEIVKRRGIPVSEAIGNISTKMIRALAGDVKHMVFPITGDMGFKGAQVTRGGLDTNGFRKETMQSKIVSGLYAAGEILDVDGPCGGYNLQWAWSSGYVAGKSMVQALVSANR